MSRPVKRATFQRSCASCGWAGTYDTAGKAAYAKRRHSCARHQRLAERRARGEQRRALVDRTPKPCLHKVAEHTHGTYACYTLDLCRCEPCAAAQSAYESNRIRQHAYGRWNGYVDSQPARDHIRELMAAGMGLKRIVAVSDVSHGVVWKLVYGKTLPDGSRTPSQRIKPSTEARILAVELDLADGAYVPSLGTVRRIQALVALGWSQSKLANRLGVEPANFGLLANGKQTQVTVGRDREVRALYEALSMTLPPAEDWRDKIAVSRARNYAAERGWLPPLAWDDELIDDPDYTPVVVGDRALVDADELDEAAIYRRLHGDKTVRLSKADATEVVRRAFAAGWTWPQIEERTGLKPDRYSTRIAQEAS